MFLDFATLHPNCCSSKSGFITGFFALLLTVCADPFLRKSARKGRENPSWIDTKKKIEKSLRSTHMTESHSWRYSLEMLV